jgi:hypothetical protein
MPRELASSEPRGTPVRGTRRSPLLNVVGWMTTIVMGVAGVGLIMTTIFG